jgi:hypothetical protein
MFKSSYKKVEKSTKSVIVKPSDFPKESTEKCNSKEKDGQTKTEIIRISTKSPIIKSSSRPASP